MTAILAVDPIHYDAASQCFGDDIAGGIGRLHDTLMLALADTGAMSGSDSVSLDWAIVYGATAADVARCIADLGSACLKLATMLQRTGFNHATAENASGRVGDQVDSQVYDTTIATSCLTIPDPSGGTGDRPDGLGKLEAALGRRYDYPDGRQDRLRDAAKAWRAAARSLGALTTFVDQAVERIELQTSPEVVDAVTVCAQMKYRLEDLAVACTQLASGCEQHATSIDRVHGDAEWFIAQLWAETFTVGAMGDLLSVITDGLSHEVAPGVAGKGARDLANALAGSIDDFAKQCDASTSTIMTAAQGASEIELLIAPILAATLTAAVVAAVPSMTAGQGDRAILAAETNFIVRASTGRPNIFAGGHAIDEHVGRTDRQLIDRHVPLASTFYRFEVAQQLTERNIMRNGRRVSVWLVGHNRTLPIETSIPANSGRIYDRATGRFKSPTKIITVLKRTRTGFVVLTSYPD